MQKSSSPPSQGVTQGISVDQWITFLAEFTRENRGAHARLEVLGPDVGFVETEDRHFDGISADTKDGERTVWIAFGSTPADHLTHGMHGATAIWLRPPTEKEGAAVEVEAKDGTKTLLVLSHPDDYALPPGSEEDRRP